MKTYSPKLTRLIILTTIFLNIVGFSIIIPVLPTFIERFATDQMTLSILLSVFALCSFFAAPAFGALSDRYGRKPLSFFATLGNSLGWWIVAFAPNLFWLFVGRIIDGITAGSLVIGQSMLSDLSKNPKDRVANLWIFGALIGIGFIVGPVLGSLLMQWGDSAPLFASAIVSLVTAIFIHFFLPETHTPAPDMPLFSWNPFSALIKYFRQETIRDFLIVWAFFSLGFSMYQSVFPFFLQNEYQIDGKLSGFVMAWVGIWMLINQSIFLRKFWLVKFSLHQLFIIGLFGSVVVKLLLGASPYIGIFLALLAISSCFNGTFRPAFQQTILSYASESHRGEMNGVAMSIMNLSLVFGPAVGGWGLEKNISPFLLSGICMALGGVWFIFKLRGYKPKVVIE